LVALNTVARSSITIPLIAGSNLTSERQSGLAVEIVETRVVTGATVVVTGAAVVVTGAAVVTGAPVVVTGPAVVVGAAVVVVGATVVVEKSHDNGPQISSVYCWFPEMDIPYTETLPTGT
jgi:hypothetical protein